MKSIILILLLGLLMLTACSEVKHLYTESPTGRAVQSVDLPVQSANQLIKGTTLSPKAWTAESVKDFFDRSKDAGEMVGWYGRWSELEDGPNRAPHVVASLTQNYDYSALVIVSPFKQSTGQTFEPLDDARIQQKYISLASDFAGRYHPEYLGFGVEINMLYEASPEDFDEFADLFSDVYSAVKTASPSTKVFTVFQLERMKGLQGGLFGGTNSKENAQWDLIDRFPSADLVAFTTYPSIIYKSPDDLSSDYYTEIRQHTKKPVAFSEIGWHSGKGPLGWDSTEENQAEFIKKFFTLTKDLNSEFYIWPFIYDQETDELFATMGLITNNGIEKQGWDVWIES